MFLASALAGQTAVLPETFLPCLESLLLSYCACASAVTSFITLRNVGHSTICCFRKSVFILEFTLIKRKGFCERHRVTCCITTFSDFLTNASPLSTNVPKKSVCWVLTVVFNGRLVLQASWSEVCGASPCSS